MPVICRRCLVDGRVQGVFYRAATIAKATELELVGWAKNLADGRVEVVIQGKPDNVAVLQDWLWEGSSASQVTSVQCEDQPVGDYTNFGVRH